MRQNLLSFIVLVASLIGIAFGQSRVVSGKITDVNGVPLSSVIVTSEATSSATQSDNYGNFQISVAPGSQISFRLIGYEEQKIRYNGEASLNVKMVETSIGLEEVVVTAYGTQNKEAITGAVASVSAKDIEKRPVSSVTAVLEGAAPGLQVNNSYGEPGSSPNIRIRGYGSINGSSAPVYVVDGVVFGGNISDINPNDVESVSVLKDATSASLYGSRAANGVIVITTKKGKAGSSNLNLSVNLGSFSRGIAEYDKVDARDFMEAAWQGYRNQLKSANPSWSLEKASEEATKGLIDNVLKTNIFNLEPAELFSADGKLNPNAYIKGDYASDLDWFKPISRNGLRQDYTVSGRGGNEKSTYYFSTNYLNEQGYIVTSDFNRLSGRLSGEITPKSWIKAGMSVNASHQKANNTTGEGSGFTNPWMFARNIAPIYPIYKHDPITGNYVLDSEGKKIFDDGASSRLQYVGRHVIWENSLNQNLTKRNTVNTQAHVDFKFLNNFTFSVLGDLNLRYNEDRTYNNALIGDGAGNNGRASRTIYNYKNYTGQQILNYANTFNAVHNVDLMAGHENYGNIYTYLYGYKTNESFAGQNHLVNFTSITSLTDYEQNDKSESYFGRARYNFAEKYFAEASLRRDGTSRVAKAHRWANFWSLGATWMISKEKFMENLGWLNSLKLRAATGVVGSLGSLGFYDYLDLYAMGQNNNMSALYRSNIGNPDLKWEGSQSSSVALEGRAFDRLNFSFEYFDKRSKDLLFNVNLPLSVGVVSNTSSSATVKKNIGDLVNRGIEISIDGDIIRHSDFTWNLGVNATLIKNKIINLPEENKENGIISSPFKYMEGHNVYDYYLRQYAGVDMLTGQALYYADTEAYDPTATDQAWYEFQEEINGVIYTRNASYAKQEFSGSGIPKVMGSINTNLSYKNWSLSGLFTYSIGGKGLDYSYIDLMSFGGTPSALHVDITKSWREAPAGMTATSSDRINPNAIPQIHFTNSQYNNATSTRFLFNNSYFVIKNIALGYRLPYTYINKLGLSRVNILLTGENLATFSARKGYSPQQTFGGYSQNQFVPYRTVSFGLSVGF